MKRLSLKVLSYSNDIPIVQMYWYLFRHFSHCCWIFFWIILKGGNFSTLRVSLTMAIWPDDNNNANAQSTLQIQRTMKSLMLIDSEWRFITQEGKKSCLGRDFYITKERDRFSWVVPGCPKVRPSSKFWTSFKWQQPHCQHLYPPGVRKAVRWGLRPPEVQGAACLTCSNLDLELPELPIFSRKSLHFIFIEDLLICQ